MLKRSKKVRRKIYDKNYYKAQAILRDTWFIKKITWLKKRFEEIGCPVPPKGFKELEQYQKWSNKFWDIRTKMYQDEEYINGVNKITGGKQKVSSDEYDQVEKFKEDYLPPVYGAVFGDILEYFKIDREDRGFRDFVERYVFFGRNEYPTSDLIIKWIGNNKTKKAEMFVQILGYTKKEDIVNNWDFISKEQKRLPDYLGKSKKWEEFDRDIEIYNLYKKLQEKSLGKRERSNALDTEVYVQLHHKYKSLTVNKIRNIVSKTAERLGEIKGLIVKNNL